MIVFFGAILAFVWAVTRENERQEQVKIQKEILKQLRRRK